MYIFELLIAKLQDPNKVGRLLERVIFSFFFGVGVFSFLFLFTLFLFLFF